MVFEYQSKNYELFEFINTLLILVRMLKDTVHLCNHMIVLTTFPYHSEALQVHETWALSSMPSLCGLSSSLSFCDVST